jgi:NADP-dependent 3-hydroxy acid dehydrogenase YdfG
MIKNTSDKAVLITGKPVMPSIIIEPQLSVVHKIALIVYCFSLLGCDSGFGYNLACQLDNLGFKVYAGCLNVQGEGAQELKKKCSDKLHLMQLDVTKDSQVASAFSSISSTLADRSIFYAD